MRETARRGGLGAIVAAVLLVMVASFVVIASPPVGDTGGVHPSLSTPPTVYSHTSFAVATSRSGTSPGFGSNSGDALFAFVSVWSANTVGSVTDSAGDTFSQLVFTTEKTPTNSFSLAIWAAYGVVGGSGVTLTVTLAGTATDCAAVDVVDVTGVGPSPLDHLGTPTTSTMSGQVDQLADNEITANAGDLVLAAISSHNYAGWSASGVDTLIDTQNALATGVRMTAADLQYTATGTGNVWMNATANITWSQWIEDSFTLRSGASASEYPVTFSESGLVTGTSWSVTLGGSTRSSTSSSIGFTEPNGTYAYTVGAVAGYTVSPPSGTVTVQGSAVPVPITFTPQAPSGETDNWPTYLGEVDRNAAQNGETDLSSRDAAQLVPLWNYAIGAGNPGYLQAEPVETNNTVYVGGGDGYFYALNATTGKLVWRSPSLGTDTRCNYPDGITSSATVTGGEVYVGGGDGYLYVLDEATGQVDWKYLIGNTSDGYYLWSSPLVLPKLGYVYIGVSSDCDAPLVDGGLDQISLTTHNLVHFFSDLSPSQQSVCATNPKADCGGAIWGSPSYDAATNTIWAATGNGYNLTTPEYGDSLMEWNATTLALLGQWAVPNSEEISDGDFGTTPTLVNPSGGPPMVFATNKNGWSYAFDRSNFTKGPVWQYKISFGPDNVAPDAFGGGLIYIGGHGTSLLGTHYYGAVRAFNPLVNKTLWAVGMPGEVYGAPAYANGIVVVVGGDLLDVLNSSTGQMLFNYTAPAPFLAAPSIAYGTIFVENTDGLVLAFGVPSSKLTTPLSDSPCTSPTPVPLPVEGPQTHGSFVASAGEDVETFLAAATRQQ